MTTTAVLERPTTTAAPAATVPARVAPYTAETRRATLSARSTALQALDGEVRARLTRILVDAAASSLPPVIDLTVYDAIYASQPAVGGHWTVAMRRPSFGGLRMATYTVLAEFDDARALVRFRVCGASESVSDDASLAALERALTTARQSGPQMTWAPAFMTGVSL